MRDIDCEVSGCDGRMTGEGVGRVEGVGGRVALAVMSVHWALSCARDASC